MAANKLVLLAEAAQEQNIAQTRSFSSMLLLVQAMVATIASEVLETGTVDNSSGRLGAGFGGKTVKTGVETEKPRAIPGHWRRISAEWQAKTAPIYG